MMRHTRAHNERPMLPAPMRRRPMHLGVPSAHLNMRFERTQLLIGSFIPAGPHDSQRTSAPV